MRTWDVKEVGEGMEWLLGQIKAASLDTPAAEAPETLLGWLLAGAAEFWELDGGWAIVTFQRERDGKKILFVLVSHAGTGMRSGLLSELPDMEEEAVRRGCVRASFLSTRKQWGRVAPSRYGYHPRVVEYVKEF